MEGPIRRVDHAPQVRNDPRQRERRRGDDARFELGEAASGAPDPERERPSAPRGDASLGRPLEEEGGGHLDLTA